MFYTNPIPWHRKMMAELEIEFEAVGFLDAKAAT